MVINFSQRQPKGSVIRFSLNLLFMGVMLVVLLTSACQRLQTPLPDRGLSASKDLRPDIPPYAVRGPFKVGYRSLVIGEETVRPLEVGIWYPALNPTGAKEEITYEFTLKKQKWQSIKPSVVYGQALMDALVDDTKGPYPLVAFSHGYTLNPEWYNATPEHYASHGFIVLAPDHIEKKWSEDVPASSIDRQHDIKQTLDYAEELTATGGAFAGQIDMENVAVVGHSYGGYTALAMGGAQYDFSAFKKRCAKLLPDDPKASLCIPLVSSEAEMAARAGLDSVPEGLWPSFGDPRVTAIVPMAGDSYLFDKAGLSKIMLPMMAIGGTADTGTPYEWGSKPSYDYAASAQKALVALEGAGHLAMGSPCENIPWITEISYYDYFCFDPVWDKRRALDLIHHFSTAFLLDILKGDQAAHEVLLPDAVQFPGIEYTTTLK